MARKRSVSKKGTRKPARRKRIVVHMVGAPSSANSTSGAPYPSYSGLLLSKILSSSDEKKSSILSEFLCALYSLSPTMSRMSYRFGISKGRLLYRLDLPARVRHKAIYRNEHMGDVLDFLEAAGIGRTTFHPTTHGTIIRVYRDSPVIFGSRIHYFEAGLIAGFLGAAGESIPHVEESQCTARGDGLCEYISMPLSARPPETSVPSPQRVRDIGYGVADSVVGTRMELKVPAAYDALLAEIAGNAGYVEELCGLASHVGIFCRARLRMQTRSPRKLWERISATIRLLNLGEPSIERKGKSIAITTTLDALFSRREFARIAASFICALAGGFASKPPNTKITSSRGRYRINITITP